MDTTEPYNNHYQNGVWYILFGSRKSESRFRLKRSLQATGLDAGLDTYFFPNLAVGQPSNNMDLSEIEIYLGIMMIFSFFVFVMKKKTNRWKLWSFVRLLFFQDCCLWSTLTHHKSFVFLSRGSVVYPSPFWRQREQDYISKDKKSMEIKKNDLELWQN